MSAIKKPITDNVIKLRVVNGNIEREPKVRYNKDGSIDKRHPNRVSGISNEVYPFTQEEIKLMVDLFDKRINEAPDGNKRQIACRNKMLFLIGINLGIRASDLCKLRYSFFMNNKMEFFEKNKLQPKKTKTKTGKYVTLYFNPYVKKAILNYIEEYPIQDLQDYLFKSRNGGNPISEHTIWDVVSKAAIEVGIEKNIGSHSLRKTFGYWALHNAKDKNKELITLQNIFGHSSPAITSRYIGITDNEMSDVFNNLDLGLDYL